MKKLVQAGLCAVLLFGMLAPTVQAQGYPRGDRSWQGGGDWHRGINDRIRDARSRIDRGVRNGSLTRHESRRLYRELDRLEAKVARMRSDGHLDPRERDAINNRLDDINRDIGQLKHNDRRSDDYRQNNDRPYRMH